VNVRVRLFAGARQAAGCETVEVDLPGGATIGELRRRMAGQFPQLSGLVGRAMFAIDTEYACDGDEIPADADVACIPPVSGG
jgi:molybdopterin converting factor small subunit